MNKLLFGVGTFVTLFSGVRAQDAPFKNTVSVGVDYMSLDAPDDLGFRFVGRYNRHLAKDRIVLSATLGYLRVMNNQTEVYKLTSRPRKRVTADFTASYDFIRNTRHALRLGTGPSVWYRQDDEVQHPLYTVDPQGHVMVYVFGLKQTNEVNVGWHVMAEYEYVIGERITVSAHGGLATLNRAGYSSIVGLMVGRRF